MVRAIPVPKSVFNPTTGQWEAPGINLTPPKKNKVAPYQPPTHIVFGGSPVADTDAIVKARKLSTDYWWNEGYRQTPKNWKHQSRRKKQHYKGV